MRNSREAEEWAPRRTAASSSARLGGGVWKMAGTPVFWMRCRKGLTWWGSWCRSGCNDERRWARMKVDHVERASVAAAMAAYLPNSPGGSGREGLAVRVRLRAGEVAGLQLGGTGGIIGVIDGLITLSPLPGSHGGPLPVVEAVPVDWQAVRKA